jgi:CRISPR-associated protein (TIGR03984 family)
VSTEAVDKAQAPDLHTWLAQQALALTKDSADKRCWLLAHCNDGVIWGEVREGQLALSCEAFPERGLALRWETLQQARLFSDAAEVLLWPGPQGWQATTRRDEQGNDAEYIDEAHLLWGTERWSTKENGEKDGFIKVIEGVQGIVHAPPVTKAPSDTKDPNARARLKVRHYLGEDEAGVVRVVASRLVGLVSPG